MHFFLNKPYYSPFETAVLPILFLCLSIFLSAFFSGTNLALADSETESKLHQLQAEMSQLQQQLDSQMVYGSTTTSAVAHIRLGTTTSEKIGNQLLRFTVPLMVTAGDKPIQFFSTVNIRQKLFNPFKRWEIDIVDATGQSVGSDELLWVSGSIFGDTMRIEPGSSEFYELSILAYGFTRPGDYRLAWSNELPVKVFDEYYRDATIAINDNDAVEGITLSENDTGTPECSIEISETKLKPSERVNFSWTINETEKLSINRSYVVESPVISASSDGHWITLDGSKQGTGVLILPADTTKFVAQPIQAISKNGNAVHCDVVVQKPVEAKIVFEEIVLDPGVTFYERVYMAGDKSYVDNDEWFPLSNGLAWIDDNLDIDFRTDFADRYPGLTIYRDGFGSVTVIHAGDNAGQKTVEGFIRVRPTSIQGFEQENFDRNDVLTPTESDHRMNFTMRVNDGYDRFSIDLLEDSGDQDKVEREEAEAIHNDQPSQSDTTKSEAVTDEDTIPVEIEAKVVFTEKSTKGGARLYERIYFPDGSFLKSDEWFPLTKNGSFINDASKAHSVPWRDDKPGLILSRTNGTLELLLAGDGDGQEYVAGFMRVREATLNNLQTHKFESTDSASVNDAKRNVKFQMQVSAAAADYITVEVVPDGKVKGIATGTPQLNRLQKALERLSNLLNSTR